MRRLLATRRRRLIAMLLLATAAISVLVVAVAGRSLSYYVTPEEYLAQAGASGGSGARWRVAGRVVADSIVQRDGRTVAFTIEGYEGGKVPVTYVGTYPNLFGPNTLVIVEGVAEGGDTHLAASSVIVKHENQFVTSASDSPVYAPARQ